MKIPSLGASCLFALIYGIAYVLITVFVIGKESSVAAGEGAAIVGFAVAQWLWFTGKRGKDE